MHYTILSNNSEPHLAAEVSAYLARGYYCAGGVTVGKDGRFHQAVFRQPRPAPAGEVQLKEPKRK